ncbi:MAG: hypothetical protein ABR532_04610 [Candidatus Dormibacteria bacterium]
MSDELAQSLRLRAEQRGEDPTAIARRYVEEGLRMDRHPGIVFRDGPGGRRAALDGHRLQVWQVIDTLKQSGGELEETAAYLRLSVAEVRAAAAYHAEHPDEVERCIRRNLAAGDRAAARPSLDGE